jgi:hypothetical protein
MSALLAWGARLGRARLVQFGLVGGAIFFLSGGARRSDDRLDLTRADLSALEDVEAVRKGRARDATLAAEVDERALEDEILYREGLKLGFEKNDAIVRQRVVQKTLYLAEELAGAGEPPTEAELLRFYNATRAQWKRPAHVHFVHVFTHNPTALEGLRPLLGAKVGEPSPVPQDATYTRDQLAAVLGADFATSLMSLEIGGAGEAIPSALGWHLVRVLEREAEAQASFEEVRASLVGVYAVKRREDAVAAFLERAFKSYTVTVDGRPVDQIRPSRRVAVRTSGSAED